MKIKPISRSVTMNNYKRFDSLYKCYCPKCNKVLKRNEEVCTCVKKWIGLNGNKLNSSSI